MIAELGNRAERSNRQGFAKIVGRVGALAVFLGVGTALAIPGVALADTDGTSSSGSSSGTSSSSGSSGPASSSQAGSASSAPGPAGPTSDDPDADDDPDISEETTEDDADGTGIELDAKRRPSAGPRTVSAPSSEVSASTVKITREDAGETPATAPTPITTATTTPKTVVHPVAEAMPAAASVSAVEPAPTPPAVSLAPVVADSMTAPLTPLAGVDPTVPATSPAAWAVLACSRRQPGSEADASGALTNEVSPLGTPEPLAAEQVARVGGPDADNLAAPDNAVDALFDGLRKLPITIGVGLERTAAGLDDSPLGDLVNHIEQSFGYLPARIVEIAFDGAIAVLGPILVANVDPLDPVSGSINVDNAIAESATFEVNSGQYIVDIGSPQNVGNGEIAGIILGAIDGDSDDSDIHQLLAELYTGASGAHIGFIPLDSETEPGIDGVTLVEVTATSVTLALNTNGVTDTLTLTGTVVENAVAPYLGGTALSSAPGNDFGGADRHQEVSVLLGDLRERPLATIVEQVLFTLSDALNFAFSVPPLRALFEAIAPGLNVADVDPLTEEPVIDVANGISETASLAIPIGEFVFEIGDTFAVGTYGGFSFFSSLLGLPISELSGILRAEVDADDNDNDAQQLLEEILNGRSGAVLDFETEPGIDGVALVGLTPASFTLAFEDGDETDRLRLEGPGAEAILAEFDARDGADLADGANNLSLIDVGSDVLELGDGAANPIFDLVGDEFAGDADLAALIAAAAGGTNASVSLISQDPGSISVRINNATTGEFDLLVFFDPTAATALL